MKIALSPIVAAALLLLPSCQTSGTAVLGSRSASQSAAITGTTNNLAVSNTTHNSTTFNISQTPPAEAKHEQLRRRFSRVLWTPPKANPTNDAALAAEFALVRQTPAWSAFVGALNAGDQAVLALMDESALDWSNSNVRFAAITSARNAWRRAATYGIPPPALSRGYITFDEGSLQFQLHVTSDSYATLVARSSRGQILGLFDLELADRGRKSVLTHMLDRPLRNPDACLNYPWDMVLATDQIVIGDVQARLLRTTNKVVLAEEGNPEPVIK